MKRALLLAAVAAAAVAFATQVPMYTGNGAYSVGNPFEGQTFFLYVPGGLLNAQTLTALKLDSPLGVGGATFRVTGASGGGAGKTVLRASNGTKNCDTTFACSSTNAQGVVRQPSAGGSNCAFAANDTLTLSVASSGCTIFQPNAGTGLYVELKYL